MSDSGHFIGIILTQFDLNFKFFMGGNLQKSLKSRQKKWSRMSDLN